MTTITVWLLMMSGVVNGGGLGAVQPHLFPTAADCEKVAHAARHMHDRNTRWQCVQTSVVKP